MHMQYFQNTQVIVMFVDSNDRDRMSEVSSNYSNTSCSMRSLLAIADRKR